MPGPTACYRCTYRPTGNSLYQKTIFSLRDVRVLFEALVRDLKGGGMPGATLLLAERRWKKESEREKGERESEREGERRTKFPCCACVSSRKSGSFTPRSKECITLSRCGQLFSLNKTDAYPFSEAVLVYKYLSFFPLSLPLSVLFRLRITKRHFRQWVTPLVVVSVQLYEVRTCNRLHRLETLGAFRERVQVFPRRAC